MLAAREGHGPLVDYVCAAPEGELPEQRRRFTYGWPPFAVIWPSSKKAGRGRAMSTPRLDSLIYAAFNGHAPVVQFLGRPMPM